MSLKTFIIFVLLSMLLYIPSQSYGSSQFKQKFFDGKLRMSSTPLVGQKTMITLDLTAISGDCGATAIKFRVSNGVSISGLSVFEESFFIKGLSRQYSVEIEVLEEGTYALQASVYFQFGVEHFFTYLIAGKTNSRGVDKVDFLTISKNGIKINSLAPSLQGTLQLSGYITYYNDNLSRTVPIRKIMVQLFENEKLISTTYTDNDGLYSFDAVNETLQNPQLRISFENDVLRLVDNNNEIYKFDLPLIQNVSDYLFDESNQHRSLGHIFNTIMDAHDFLQSKLNWSRQRINVKWPYQGQDNSRYTYLFRLNGEISNECICIAVERQWERMSMLHEYGHSVMMALYGYNYRNIPKDNFYGDPDANYSHFINTVSAPEFAIKEGWAEFFEALVDDNAYNTTQYINADTPNIEYNNWWKGKDGNNTKGELVEGVVASILWDVVDTPQSNDEVPNADDDDMNGKLRELWDLMSNYKPSDIIELWDNWVEHGYDQVNALYSIYSNNHVKVILPWDVNEDSKVDFSDLSLASSYFGQSVSSPAGFNPDVNRDGKVNIIDLVIISKNMTP